MQARSILHCDLNNFYASVECILNPSLNGKPVAVCGDPEARHGIVLAKNQLAKIAGVKTAEAIWEAKVKCPDLVCVPPHYGVYLEYSRKVQEIYNQYTDFVEPFGLDECWLDVTGSKIFGTGFEIAEKIREEVKQKTGLTISVGVSFTKSFAKLGSDHKKPDATTVFSKSNFKKLVWPKPVGELFMVGKKTAGSLNRINIFTIGDLAAADEELLKSRLGVNGTKMIDSARGLDNSTVSRFTDIKNIKSVGHGTTASKDIETYEDAERVVFLLSEMVAVRLRRYGYCGKTVCLDLRYNDLSHISRQLTLLSPTFTAKEAADGAVVLLRKHWNPGKDLALRTITVSVANLSPINENIQQNLFAKGSLKEEQLETAADKIRGKYGFNSLMRANTAGITFIADKNCDEDDLLPFKR